ncbi:hypothetical protein DV735_g1732, partial [Chaetothyriales sp. CBS 134920]
MAEAAARSKKISDEAVKPTIGILSIGEMGLGIAKLLISHDYTVTTCTARRSQTTRSRIKSASIQGYDTDAEFVGNSDIIFSIVPPRDAVATAKRVAKAAQSETAIEARAARTATSADRLLYIDMNAISPLTSQRIAQIFEPARPPRPAPPPRRLSLIERISSFASHQSAPASPTNTTDAPPLLPLPPPPRPAIPISYLDGGIIGGPPHLSNTSSSSADTSTWTLPSIIVSGPPSATTSPSLPPSLQTLLNISIISPTIGHASTLKCSFASLTKGLTAIATLSFTTAHSQSPTLLPHLLDHLEQYAPSLHNFLVPSLSRMPPKAYRWIDEMHEIGQTFSAPVDQYGGGFGSSSSGTPSAADGNNSTATNDRVGQRLFDAIANVYRIVNQAQTVS